MPRVNYEKLLNEKFVPETDRERVLGSLVIHLDKRCLRLEAIVAELLKGVLAGEEAGGEQPEANVPGEPERQRDQTPFPAGVSAGGAAQPTNGPPVAEAAGQANKTGPMDEGEDLTPNVAGGPAMNPRPNISQPVAK